MIGSRVFARGRVRRKIREDQPPAVEDLRLASRVVNAMFPAWLYRLLAWTMVLGGIGALFAPGSEKLFALVAVVLVARFVRLADASVQAREWADKYVWPNSR